MPLTRRFFACSFAFFRVIALLSVCVITNNGRKECRFPAHSGQFCANEDGLAYAAALHVAVAARYLNGKQAE